MFAGLWSNVISSLCSKDFLQDGGNGLSGEKGVGSGARLPPTKCVKKALISRITLRQISALDLTQIFE